MPSASSLTVSSSLVVSPFSLRSPRMARSCLCPTWWSEMCPVGLITRWENKLITLIRTNLHYTVTSATAVIHYSVRLYSPAHKHTNKWHYPSHWVFKPCVCLCMLSWSWTLRSEYSAGVLVVTAVWVTRSRRTRWFLDWSNCLTFLDVVPVRSVQATSVPSLLVRWVRSRVEWVLKLVSAID